MMSDAELTDLPDRMVFTPSPVRTLGYGALSAVLCLVGVFAVSQGAWQGWPAALFFGVGALVAVVLSLPGANGLVLTREGYVIRRGWISTSRRWEEIGPVEAHFGAPARERQFVVFDLVDGRKRPGRKLNRALVQRDEGISALLFKEDPLLVAMRMNAFRDRALREPR